MIGLTIKNLLDNDGTLTALVPAANIFPYVINENTTLPAIFYTIDSLQPEYTKGGWVNDDIAFSVHSAAKDYPMLQNIVAAIRGALELKKTGYSTQDINNIYLVSQDEGYNFTEDCYQNRLQFRVILNKY
jgi:hypothetical protein